MAQERSVTPVVEMPPPNSLLRLSFDTHAEFQSYSRSNAKMLREIWFWHETLGNSEAQFHWPGVCDICECRTTFSAAPVKLAPRDHFAFRVVWWMSFLCGCNMSNLSRAVYRAFLDGGGGREDRIYHVGHYSHFRKWLCVGMPNVTASQYEEGRRPGETSDGVRYETLTGLSFEDGAFDWTICMEVLEHVPDYKAALREMARTLRSGGRALLSFPWLGGDNYEHFVRAEQLPDGSIQHLHPPEYHGDPAKAEGILSFRDFGWRILDELRDAGFTRASAIFVFGPLHGYMTALHPVIVAVR